MGRRGVYLRNSDAFTWYMEQDPLLRSTVVCVLVLEGSPDWDVLEDRLERATRLTPGFRHRVTPSPLRLSTPRWVVDPDFDLAWHLRRFEAAAPRTLATVLEFARKTGMAGFDRDRALWEYTFVEGLEGGRTALVMKFHHTLSDGVGGMDIARLLFDVEPQPGDLGPMPEAPVGEHPGTAALMWEALRRDVSGVLGLAQRALTSAIGVAPHVLRHPHMAATESAATAWSVAQFMRPAPDTLSPVMAERRPVWHYDVLTFPASAVLNAAHAAGATHNDAFLAGVTAGLRRYHERLGKPVDELRVAMPVSVRAPDDPLGGNRILLMVFEVPVSVADPSERVRLTHERCAPVKADRALPFAEGISAALNLLPRNYVGGALKHIDFLASNVHGVPTPFYLAGARVDDFYGFGPTIGTAVNTTLMTYCGRCFVGVNIDTGAVPDPTILMDCLQSGFDEVLAVAGAAGQVNLPGRAA